MVWMKELLNNPFVQAFLAIFGVAGSAWGIYSHWFSNRRKRFSTAYSSFEIIKQGKNTIPNLSLSFSGKEIHNLSITSFAIWNSGNKVINSTDMVSSQKLQIVADKDSEILDAQIVTESETSNCFKISNTYSNRVCLDFDYVDSREGLVLQVLHTGNINSLKVDGKIKGGKPIKRLDTETKPKRRSPIIRQAMRRILAVLMIIEAVILTAMTIILTLVNVGSLSKTILTSIDNVIYASRCAPFYLTIFWGFTIFLLITSLKILRDAYMVGVPSKLKAYADSFER